MKFDWDTANVSHIARRHVSAEEVEEAFRNYPVDLGFENDEGEERMTQLGSTKTGRILVLICTWRFEKIRVVTAFDATRTM